MAGEIKRVIRIDGTQAEAALRSVGAAAEQAATKARELAANAAKAAQALQQRMATAARAARQRMDDLKDGFEKLAMGMGGPVAQFVGPLYDFIDGAMKLGAAFGPVGVAVAGTAAALTAFAAAGGIAVAASIALVKAAGEAAGRLEKLRGIVPIDEDKISRIKDANRAFSGFTLSVDHLTVALGSQLAPTVRRIVVLSSAVALALADAVNVTAKWGQTIGLLIDLALRPLDTMYSLLIRGTIALHDALGIELPDAIRKTADGFASMLRPTQTAALSMKGMEFQLGNYVAQAETLIAAGSLAEHFEANQKAAEEARKALDEKAKATEEERKQEEEAARAVEKHTRALEAQTVALKARAAVGIIGAGVGGIDTAALRDQAARRSFALADDRNSLANLRAAEIDRLARALQTAPVDRSAGRRGMTGSAALQGAIGAGQALAGGDVLGLLGMAGPQGAAAAAIVGAIQTLGEQGAAQVGQQIQATVGAIGEGLRQIPVLLGEVLPAVISDTLPDLVVALAESLPAILREAFLFQFRLTKELFTTLPQQLGEAFGRALGEWWERAREWIRLVLTGQWREAAGGNERTARERLGRASRIGLGIATLGTSELAIRGTQGILDGLGIERGRDRSREARRERGGGGGGVSVFVDALIADAGAVERLTRRLSRETGDRGRRLGWGSR